MRLYQRLLGADTAGGVRRASNVSLEELLTVFADPNRALLPTSWGNMRDEEVAQIITDSYRANGPIFALTQARVQVFAQARFQWTRSPEGAPTELFGSRELSVLETPWKGARTEALLARMEVDNTQAGNAYFRRLRRPGEPERFSRLRPDWVYIILGSQEEPDSPYLAADAELLGYVYRPLGNDDRARVLEPHEVIHYAPTPDPLYSFRGMSWVTPSLPTMRADAASEIHKSKFFENAATPNMAITFDPSIAFETAKKFKEMLEEEHRGPYNAYKTLYLGGGADPKVIGADFKQMDFSAVQGKGETRLAANAGVPPSWVGFSEGLQGSALNDGNFTAQRRRFSDGTIQDLWNHAAAACERVLEKPASRPGEPAARLVVDQRAVPFLRANVTELADARQKDATTITTLTREGFTPESAIAAVRASDWTLLKHTGLISVQVQPGQAAPATTPEGSPE